jgi:hypothetical protein
MIHVLIPFQFQFDFLWFEMLISMHSLNLRSYITSCSNLLWVCNFSLTCLWFICSTNILFYVDVDMIWYILDATGVLGSDYIAAKVAGNELRGLIHYFNCGISGINVPLMTLVDYLGYRLIAMAVSLIIHYISWYVWYVCSWMLFSISCFVYLYWMFHDSCFPSRIVP